MANSIRYPEDCMSVMGQNSMLIAEIPNERKVLSLSEKLALMELEMQEIAEEIEERPC